MRRVTELQRLVYYEIEERHFRGGKVGVVNSLTVFDSTSTAGSVISTYTLQQAQPARRK